MPKNLNNKPPRANSKPTVTGKPHDAHCMTPEARVAMARDFAKTLRGQSLLVIALVLASRLPAGSTIGIKEAEDMDFLAEGVAPEVRLALLASLRQQANAAAEHRRRKSRLLPPGWEVIDGGACLDPD